MKITSVTDSEQLKLTWAYLRLAAPGTVYETAKRNVPGRRDLDWWLECHPAGRNADESDKVVFCLKVSAMPVKCLVKYTLGDISETREVMYSKLLDPYIFSIDKLAMYAIKPIGGWTFKCEVTFTDVPNPVAKIPNTVTPPNDGQLSMSRAFTDTIDLVIRPDDCENKKFYEIFRRPISEDGKLFWSVFYCVEHHARTPHIKMYMQSSVSACTIVMTYEIAADKILQVRQEKVDNVKPIGRCPVMLQLEKVQPINGEVIIRCTASFIFDEPIQVYKSPFGADVCLKVSGFPRMRRPCEWGPVAPIVLDMSHPEIPVFGRLQLSPLVIFNDSVPVDCSALIPFLLMQQYPPQSSQPAMLQYPPISQVRQEPLFYRLPHRSMYTASRPMLSDVHKSPCGIMWRTEFKLDFSKPKKIVQVYLHVFKAPVRVDVVYSVPEAHITDGKVMTISETDPMPQPIFEIDHDFIAKRPIGGSTVVLFSFVFSTTKKDEPEKSESGVESSHEVPIKRILTITDPRQITVSGGLTGSTSVADSTSFQYDSKSSLTEYTLPSGSGVPSERSFDDSDNNISTQASADAIAALTCNDSNNVLTDSRNVYGKGSMAGPVKLLRRLPSQNRKTMRKQPFPRYEDASFMFSQSSDEEDYFKVKNITTDQRRPADGLQKQKKEIRF